MWFATYLMCIYVCMILLMTYVYPRCQYTLLMASRTVIIRAADCFWLKPLAMVLFVLWNAVSVEYFLLQL